MTNIPEESPTNTPIRGRPRKERSDFIDQPILDPHTFLEEICSISPQNSNVHERVWDPTAGRSFPREEPRERPNLSSMEMMNRNSINDEFPYLFNNRNRYKEVPKEAPVPNYLYREPIEYRRMMMPYSMRKRRKNGYATWNADGQGFGAFPPSRYSSLEFIRGTTMKVPYSPPVIQPDEKSQNNHTLPNILESGTALSEEQKGVLMSYRNAVQQLDLENITVFQLKCLLKEYGLNHGGKKNELIEFVKSVQNRIERMDVGTSMKPKVEKKLPQEGISYDKFFF